MPDPSFVHLHTQSYYSFLEGLASPAELAGAAARYGMPALALTDRIGLSGAIEFYLACQDAGVRPILGLILPVASPATLETTNGDLVLLAVDLAGWSSLCRLSSAIMSGGTASPSNPLPFDILAQEAQGLLCLTGSVRGGLAPGLVRQGRERALEGFLGALGEVFQDRAYVELQIHAPGDQRVVEALVRLGRKFSLPVVATHSVYYLDPDARPASGTHAVSPSTIPLKSAALQRLVTAIRLNQKLSEVSSDEYAPPNAYFTSPQEMATRFAGYPEALAGTLEIAERCRSFELPLGTPLYPQIAMPPGQTAGQVLRQVAEAGARRFYGEITEAVRARLDHELSIIEDKGYAPLFLIMKEILDHARAQGVPVSSRGSAASSLVAYCLEITSPDPLRHNLFFERFLNPARASPPDIDTDLCSRRRDEVIRFVYKEYGDERVAMVSTINRFRSRSALRETAKAYGLSGGEISRMVDALPWRWHWRSSRKGESPYADLARQFQGEHHRAIFSGAEALIGMPRHLSVHPGGVVIAPGPLTDLTPTQLAPKGMVITQFDLESIAHLGLVKIDLLGIRGLTVLGDTAAAIRERDPRAYAEPLGPLKAIPDRDPMTADLVKAGRTIGCFQIESPGMQATLKEVQAGCIDDVMVALALYRPGPLTGGLKDAFVRRHRGEEEDAYLHPALRSLLEETHGVILYQEQVLRIAHELAGLDLADADLLRRAMSHFDPGEQMRTLKERFLAGAGRRNQVPEEIAGRIWELMAAFAGYGFPKAHAASYAQIAWQSAWCKAHVPEVFMAAVLANWGGYYSQRIYLTEARRMGLALRPPHVNYARREFSVSHLDGHATLFMGLDQVRDLTRRTQTLIISGRPFRSFGDFLERVDPRPVEADNLVRCGALAGFGEIPRLLASLKSEYAENLRGGQLPLFGFDEPLRSINSPSNGFDEPFEAINGSSNGFDDPAGVAGDQAAADWTLEEKVVAQEEILGVGVDAHPLELVAEQIAAAGAISTVEAAGRIGERVRVAGLRFSGRRSRDEQAGYHYTMSLEDLESMLEVTVPDWVYRRDRSAISDKQPFIVEGEVELDEERGEPVLLVERVWRIKK